MQIGKVRDAVHGRSGFSSISEMQVGASTNMSTPKQRIAQRSHSSFSQSSKHCRRAPNYFCFFLSKIPTAITTAVLPAVLANSSRRPSPRYVHWAQSIVVIDACHRIIVTSRPTADQYTLFAFWTLAHVAANLSLLSRARERLSLQCGHLPRALSLFLAILRLQREIDMPKHGTA